jgi:hypothetical protein
MRSNTINHEQFVQSVREFTVKRALELGQINADEAQRLNATKLLYGVGKSGVRGVCYYGSWKSGETVEATVEISAATQENFVQLAGTTVHELGHVLAGHTAGHDTEWKDACVRLGFVKRPMAAGQTYRLALFNRSLREFAHSLAQRMADGSPAFGASQSGLNWLTTALLTGMGRPCGAGTGTRGGKSRGTGSGSRLRKWVCAGECGQIVRASTDSLAVTCDADGTPYVRG